MPTIAGSDLVNKFRQYEFVRYVWGGASPVTGWDCSGAVNFVVASFPVLSIPGFGPGQFNPSVEHGPVVQDWIQWIGVTRGVFGPIQPVAGDLIAWGPNVHMGMAIDATTMVSAENPNDGTREADIGSFFPFAPYVLRLLQIRIGASLPTIPRPPGPGADDYSPTIIRTAQHIETTGRSAYNAAVAIRGLRR